MYIVLNEFDHWMLGIGTITEINNNNEISGRGLEIGLLLFSIIIKF